MPGKKPARAFSDEEKSAMRQRAAEARARKNATPEEAEREVLAKIAEMPAADRAIAERIHSIVKAAAPELTSRTWYGMPAYARAGEIVCFFQPASKFKVRYATLGFSDEARLDEGRMWPNAYALTGLTEAEEQKIAGLVKRAVG